MRNPTTLAWDERGACGADITCECNQSSDGDAGIEAPDVSEIDRSTRPRRQMRSFFRVAPTSQPNRASRDRNVARMAANKVTAVRAGTFGNPSRCRGKLRAAGLGR